MSMSLIMLMTLATRTSPLLLLHFPIFMAALILLIDRMTEKVNKHMAQHKNIVLFGCFFSVHHFLRLVNDIYLQFIGPTSL